MRHRSIQRFLIGVLSILFAATSMPVYGEPSCENADWGAPIENELDVIDAFDVHSNPDAPHSGVDYKAGDGDNLLAVADGEIVWIGYQVKNLSKTHPRTGKMIRGWGWNIVVKHEDGSATRYAHLLESSIDKSKINRDLKIPVVKGGIVGQADSSGGVSGSHLHFEYYPNGEHWTKNSANDPQPCMPGQIVCDPELPTPSISCTQGNCDEITVTSSKQYSLDNSQGDVKWTTSGAEASIDQTGLLTINGSGCGAITITAEDSCSGKFTHIAQVFDNNDSWEFVSSVSGCGGSSMASTVCVKDDYKYYTGWYVMKICKADEVQYQNCYGKNYVCSPSPPDPCGNYGYNNLPGNYYNTMRYRAIFKSNKQPLFCD